IAASTLFGIRQTTAEDQIFQPQSMRDNPLNGPTLDQNTIDRLRQELQQQPGSIDNPNGAAPTPGASPTPSGALPNRPLSSVTPNSPLASGSVTSDLATGPGAQTDQGVRQRLTLMPAQQQSAQY